MTKCKTKTLPSTHTSNRNGVAKRPFKGVRMRSWGSWVSEIRAPGHKTRIWLGSYSTAEAAARAYDAALLCLRSKSDALPGLNFPSSTTTYMSSNVALGHDSMSPKSIQRVAAAAAHSTAPTTSSSANCLSTTSPSSDSISPQSNQRVTTTAEQSTTPTSSSSANYPSTTSSSSSIPPSPSMASSSGQASGESLLDYDVGSFQLSPKLLHDMSSTNFYPYMSSMNFYPYMSSVNFYPWDEQDLGENGDLNLWSF